MICTSHHLSLSEEPLCADSAEVYKNSTDFGRSGVVLGEVHCVGNEADLLECPREEYACAGINITAVLPIFISCYSKTNKSLVRSITNASIPNLGCEGEDVQLYGGSNSSNGFIYLCQNKTLFGICSDGWGSEEIGVVCNQLYGYPEGMCKFLCQL